MKRLLLATLLAGVLSAQGLTLLTEPAPPWQRQDERGEATGPAVEVVRELQRRVGNRDPIQVMPWARGYAMACGQPNVALFLMARTRERNPLFHWVGPVMETTYSLYVRADSELELASLEEARRLARVGVYRDDAKDQLLTEAGFTNLERTTDNVMNARKLLAGRIDALASSRAGVADLMAAAGAGPDRVREALSFARIQFWIAFSKETSATTVETWSRAFEALRRDHTLEHIFRKEVRNWLPPGPPITSF